MVFKFLFNLFILIIISVSSLYAYDYTPILEFEVNLSENGNLINGYRDVTLTIYKDSTLTDIQSQDSSSLEDDPSVVYTQTFEQTIFTDGNTRLFIGYDQDQPINPSWFNGSINIIVPVSPTITAFSTKYFCCNFMYRTFSGAMFDATISHYFSINFFLLIKNVSTWLNYP